MSTYYVEYNILFIRQHWRYPNHELQGHAAQQRKTQKFLPTGRKDNSHESYKQVLWPSKREADEYQWGVPWRRFHQNTGNFISELLIMVGIGRIWTTSQKQRLHFSSTSSALACAKHFAYVHTGAGEGMLRDIWKKINN